jgi:hypothetical protein
MLLQNINNFYHFDMVLYTEDSEQDDSKFLWNVGNS